MSCDTSDPRILEAYSRVQAKDDENDWLLLAYDKAAPSPDIVFSQSGTGAVGGLRDAIGSSDEEVLFGLVSVQGHELLVSYMSEAVVDADLQPASWMAGVRRARTIVHSRAVAKLFPDHHSTLTISHASELSDTATSERLHIDEAQTQQYQQQVQAHSRAVSNGSMVRSRVDGGGIGLGHPSNQSIVSASQGQEVLSHSQSPTSNHPPDQLPALPAPSPRPEHSSSPAHEPSGQVPSMELGPPIGSSSAPHSRSVSSAATYQRAPPVSTAPLVHPQPISIDQRRIVSTSAVPPTPSSPGEPATPTSSASRFKSMIPKFARKTRRSSSSATASQGGSAPNSPNPAQIGFPTSSLPAPPVPPKDKDSEGFVDAPPSGENRNVTPPPFVPPHGRASYAPNGHAQTHTFPRDPVADDGEAATALHQARERSLSVETEIQERYRREQLGYGKPGNGSEDTGTEDEIGLPYDREDHEPSAEAGLATLTEVQSSTSLSREAVDAQTAENLAAAAAAHAERLAAEREREEQEAQREAEERDRLERERLAELARVEQDARLERERIQELERIENERVEAENARLLAEEQERERIQAERLRLAEEERVRKQDEEKARVLAEAEKKRQVQESLVNQHRQGGTMLSGWITVQSPNSMAWRRRWFKLLPTELQLYKTESDASTIGQIPLVQSTALSIRYEESQVKDSFKLVVQAGHAEAQADYYLFADSHEDLQVILQGLRIALGHEMDA